MMQPLSERRARVAIKIFMMVVPVIWGDNRLTAFQFLRHSGTVQRLEIL